MKPEDKQTIIIKKVNKRKKDSHGGAWKIAYADFVTAMMAFFMLMWLLSLLNKYQQQGVAAYFKKPLTDIFVGSKNAEQYKNQTNAKVLEIKQGVGSNVNSDVEVRLKKVSVMAIEQEIKKHDVKKQSDDNQSNNVSQEKKAAKQEKGDKTEIDKEKEKIKKNLEMSLRNNTKLDVYEDNMSFEIVKDGVKISLHDSSKNKMFSIGKADLKNYSKNVILWLSDEFNKIPKKIIIIGHTDSNTYEYEASYTNWELSTDRANKVRYLLIKSGMDADKIIRVEGAGSVSLLDKINGDNPLNRRVEIIVLTDEAAKRITEE